MTATLHGPEPRLLKPGRGGDWEVPGPAGNSQGHSIVLLICSLQFATTRHSTVDLQPAIRNDTA